MLQLIDLTCLEAAIDALTKVLLKVDPTNFIEHNNQVYFATDKSTMNDQGHDSSFRKRRSTGSTSTSHHHQPLNRTEVINHATILIEKLASESEELKLKMMQFQHMPNAGDMSKGNGVAAMSMMSQFPLQQVCIFNCIPLLPLFYLKTFLLLTLEFLLLLHSNLLR